MLSDSDYMAFYSDRKAEIKWQHSRFDLLKNSFSGCIHKSVLSIKAHLELLFSWQMIKMLVGLISRQFIFDQMHLEQAMCASCQVGCKQAEPKAKKHHCRCIRKSVFGNHDCKNL